MGCHLQACNTWRMLSGSKRQIYIKPSRFKSSHPKQRPAHYGLIRRVLCTPLCGYSDAECCTFGGCRGAKHSPPRCLLGRPSGKIHVSTQIGNFGIISAHSSGSSCPMDLCIVGNSFHTSKIYLCLTRAPKMAEKTSAGVAFSQKIEIEISKF